MFWDWSWSWHFIVFCNKTIVLCHCLRIDIHEIIHVNLNLVLIIKPLHLFIFVLFYCYVSDFSFITFCCFTCKNFRYLFSPISDNNYFSFSIRFSIRILADFNHYLSISLFRGVIYRIFFVIFPLYALCFYWVINMSYLALLS